MKKLMTSTFTLGAFCVLTMNQPMQAGNTESAAPQTILVHGGGHHSGSGNHSGGSTQHTHGGQHHTGNHYGNGYNHHYGHGHNHGYGYGYGWGAAGVGAAVIGTDIIYENTYQGNGGYQEYPVYPGNPQESQEYQGSYGPQVYEYNN